MQACPYDALYLDPNTHTAAKCNFCAHRVEMNLEPACVIVCPTRAIIAGDIDNPDGEIGQIIATQKVAARKPQKATRPKLFYVGIEGDLLQPSMMEPQPSHAFAERDADANPRPGSTLSYNASRQNNDRPNPGAARVVYDVAHSQPWGSIPAFYLWTKSIAAGALIVAAMLLGFSAGPHGAPGGRLLFTIMAPSIALVFTGITTLLLIADLHRPERFYYILLKPNPRSWLVVGTWILIAYSILAAIWLGLGVAVNGPMPPPIVAASAGAGVCTAGYSAFLFAQAKGRDLWQSPLFLWHLLMQAIVAGAATMILLAIADGYPHSAGAIDGGRDIVRLSNLLLLIGVTLSLLMILAELTLTPLSADMHYAAQVILRGRLRDMFWFGVVGLGSIAPAGILLYTIAAGVISPSFEVLTAILSLGGLLIFEKVWIDAGQAPPLS